MANIVDPVEMLMKTKSLLVPTNTHHGHHHTPLPTVVPDIHEKQKAGHTGHLALWVVFVIMLAASVIFTGLSWKLPASKRLYHIVTTLITIIAALSYFAMATGAGVGWHHIVEHNEHIGGGHSDHHVSRQVYWARYVDWSLTTPLLLLDLFLLAGSNGATITQAVVADVVMVLTGLFAAFGDGRTEKWGWYAIGCIAYLVIVWHLALNGRAAALTKGGNVAKFYSSITAYTLILWTAYPIVWGIADGARRVSVDTEILAYAVLDVLAKPIFGLWLLFTHARLPETNVEVGGFWAHGFGGEGRIRLDDDDGA